MRMRSRLSSVKMKQKDFELGSKSMEMKKKKKKQRTWILANDRPTNYIVFAYDLWSCFSFFFIFLFLFKNTFIPTSDILYTRGSALVNMNTVWWFLAAIKRKIHNAFLLCVKIRRRKSNSGEREKNQLKPRIERNEYAINVSIHPIKQMDFHFPLAITPTDNTVSQN